MLHIAHFIQQRFPDQAPRVIKMLVTVSAIAVVVGLAMLLLR